MGSALSKFIRICVRVLGRQAAGAYPSEEPERAERARTKQRIELLIFFSSILSFCVRLSVVGPWLLLIPPLLSHTHYSSYKQGRWMDSFVLCYDRRHHLFFVTFCCHKRVYAESGILSFRFLSDTANAGQCWKARWHFCP